jgi:hypothetical protein
MDRANRVDAGGDHFTCPVAWLQQLVLEADKGSDGYEK